eukprot:6115193-Pyramimonas_sp.AAC.1
MAQTAPEPALAVASTEGGSGRGPARQSAAGKERPGKVHESSVGCPCVQRKGIGAPPPPRR